MKTMSTKASTSNGGKESKFRKCLIEAPMKFLRKARELYVRSFSGCYSGQVSSYLAYGSGGAYPTPHLASAITTFPRSFSTTSASSNYSAGSDDDLLELIRAASTRKKKELEILNRQPKQPAPGGIINNSVPRSRTSVAIIGRIDEDSPCEFGSEDVMIKMKRDFYSRSRSYAAASAVPPRRRVSYSS